MAGQKDNPGHYFPCQAKLWTTEDCDYGDMNCQLLLSQARQRWCLSTTSGLSEGGGGSHPGHNLPGCFSDYISRK